MRIDLYRHDCASLVVHGEFNIRGDSSGELRELLNSTRAVHAHHHDSGRFNALFASRYAIGKNHLGVIILVLWEGGPQDDVTVCVNFIAPGEEPLTRPGTGTKAVSHLLDFASVGLDPISGSCVATFRYLESDGFRSTASLPFALPVQEHSDGVTHIEEALFIRREGDDVKYSVGVTEEEETIMHRVEFETGMQLTRGFFVETLDKASSYSKQLVVGTRGKAHDND